MDSAVTSRITLAKDMDALCVLVGFCDIHTRLGLVQVCPESKQSVAFAIRKDSGPLLAKLGTALSRTLSFIVCDDAEVLEIVKAAIDSQFIVCVSQCCALLFVKRGDRWLVAVHCDDRRVAVVGWKQPVEEWSQRRIQRPITERPTVSVSIIWETRVYGWVQRMANCGNTIAVGTTARMALLNAQTGDVVTDALKGNHVAFLDKGRVVGVKNERGKWLLFEFTADTLTFEVPMEASNICSMIASANGKRLYVCDSDNNQLLEYSTDNWLLTARIPLSGVPLGQCDIAANGLLAQGIYQREDDSFHIEVIESNTRCVTQIIRTKHTNGITQVVFSPDSSHIVSVSNDRSAQLLDAISGQMVGEPRVAHRKAVYSLCFLTDALFVTVSWDNSVVLWHCDSQPAIARIEDAHSTYISSVLRLTTDSFVTADVNGTVKQWKVKCK